MSISAPLFYASDNRLCLKKLVFLHMFCATEYEYVACKTVLFLGIMSYASQCFAQFYIFREGTPFKEQFYNYVKIFW